MTHLPFTIRQLEVFSSLYSTRSFRLSAERFGISQASVSSQLKVLEHQLGFRLFERMRGRQPVPTPEGVAFLRDLEAFWTSAAKLSAHRRKEACGGAPPAPIRIMTGQGLLDNYIRPKLAAFFAQHPAIALDFASQPPNDRLIASLDDDRYDCALLHMKAGATIPAGWRSLALVPGGIYGHRYLAQGRALPLSTAEVSALPFLLPKSGSVQERELLAALKRYGIHPANVVGHFQYYDVIVDMLERGVAVAGMTSAMIRPDARANVIMLCPMEDWRLVWFRRANADDARQDAVERFLITAVVGDPNYPSRLDSRAENLSLPSWTANQMTAYE